MTFYPVFLTWGKETGDDDDDGDTMMLMMMMITTMMYSRAKERVVLER